MAPSIWDRNIEAFDVENAFSSLSKKAAVVVKPTSPSLRVAGNDFPGGAAVFLETFIYQISL